MDPLKINIEVNTGDLAKLAESSQTTATSVSSLSDQFLKGGLSAEEIAAAVTSAASSFIAANPAVLQQTSNLVELQAALATAKASLRETGDIIIEAGGKEGAAASILRQFGIETKVVADLQAILKQSTQQANLALAGTAEASATAATGTKAQTVATEEAAIATAANATEAEAATVALGQTGETAKLLGALLLSSSEDAQAAGASYAAVTRDLATMNAQLVQAKTSMLGLSEEEAASSGATARYLEQRAAVTKLTRDATEAEKAYNAAIAQSATRIAAGGSIASNAPTTTASTTASVAIDRRMQQLEKLKAQELVAKNAVEETGLAMEAAGGRTNASADLVAKYDAALKQLSVTEKDISLTEAGLARIRATATAGLPAQTPSAAAAVATPGAVAAVVNPTDIANAQELKIALLELTAAENAHTAAALRASEAGIALAASRKLPSDSSAAIAAAREANAADAALEQTDDRLAAAKAAVAEASTVESTATAKAAAASQTAIAAEQRAVIATEARKAAVLELTAAQDAQIVAFERFSSASAASKLGGTPSAKAPDESAAITQEQELNAADAALAETEERVSIAKIALTEATANETAAQTAATEATAQSIAATAAASDAQAQSVAGTTAATAAANQSTEATNTAATAAAAATESNVAQAASAELSAASTVKKTVATEASGAATRAALSSSALAVQSLMKEGLTAEEAGQQLVKSGIDAQTMTKALQELSAAGLITAQTEVAAGAAAQELGDQHEVAAVKIDAMTRVLASSGVRIAAAELGVGQLGYALSRIGGISQTLAPILAAAFPIFAAVAFIQIMEMVVKGLQEWANEAEKSAEEMAKWDREVLKSGEEVDKWREKIAGVASPLAESSQRMADLQHKTVDLTSEVTQLNKVVNDAPSTWKKFKESVGAAYEWTFSDSASKATEQLDKQNLQINSNLKTNADYAQSITAVKNKIEEMRAEEEKLTQTLAVAKAAPREAGPGAGIQGGFERELQKRIDEHTRLIGKEEEFQKLLENKKQAFGLELISIQEGIDEKLINEMTRASLARISLEEAEAKATTKLHIATYEDEKNALLLLEDERRAALLAENANNEKLLAQQKKQQPGVNFAPAEKALAEERLTIVRESEQRIFEIKLGANVKVIEAAHARADAEIAADEKVTAAHLRLEEAKEQIAFSRADTPEKVEAAAIPLIRTATAEYENEAAAIRKNVAALLDKLAKEQMVGKQGPVQTPTAEIGTPEFKKQIQPIAAVDPALYNKIIALMAELEAKREEFNAKGVQSEEETARKIREIRSQDLTNDVAELQNGLVVEREKLQDGTIALQAGLAQRKERWSNYYADIKRLAEANFTVTQGLLDKERQYVENAFLDGVKSAEEAERMMIAIDRREEEAKKDMYKRELSAAKEAIKHEEQEVTAAANKIAQAFVRMGNTLLTTHTSIGKAAMQLGRELELYIIEQGIKTVVTHYATSLLQMLASHSSFLANLLGIQTAGDAAQQAVDDTKAAGQIGAEAGVAGAAGFASVMEALPFPANVATAPEVAAAAAAATMSNMAYLAAEQGAVLGNGQMQPVLVHSGEVITHSQTLNALSSPSSTFSSSTTNQAVRVDRDQVSMLGPGMVVVPKALAGGLASAVQSAGGSVGVAQGTVPPAGIREIPQKLPSGVSSAITTIISQHSEESVENKGGSTLQHMPAAAAGFVSTSARDYASAKDGYVSTTFVSAAQGVVMPTTSFASAAQGAVMPSNMTAFTTLGGHVAPGLGVGGGVHTENKTIHNHFRPTINVHHPGRDMTQQDIVLAVKKGVRDGSLSFKG